MPYKYGKQPAKPDPKLFKLTQFAEPVQLTPAPVGFGHEEIITNWGVLANNRVGDCVIAGGEHETMMFNKIAGRDVSFTDTTAIKDYGAIGGYVEGDESTDNGCDMQTAMIYRRQTGLVDANGNMHKIGAYVGLEVGNFNELLKALYVFDAVGIGIECPAYIMDQFNEGKPWDLNPDGDQTIEGGHYIPVVGYPEQDVVNVITWGEVQKMTRAFYEKFNDESYGFFSEESLVNGKSPEGFDLAALQAAITALQLEINQSRTYDYMAISDTAFYSNWVDLFNRVRFCNLSVCKRSFTYGGLESRRSHTERGK